MKNVNTRENTVSHMRMNEKIDGLKIKGINKPSLFNFALCLLVLSFRSNRNQEKITQRKTIEDYKLLKAIKKENGYIDSFVGCYEKNEKRFFIKTFKVDKRGFGNYFVIDEWIISNVLYDILKSKKSLIRTPKPERLIASDEFVSIVYELVEGKTLGLFTETFQAEVLVKVINELKKVSYLLTKEEIKLFPRRSRFFYLASLPYLSLLTFIKIDKDFRLVIKAFLSTFTMLIMQKTNKKLILAHRDLKPRNIIVKDSKIYLIDTGRLTLTIPGYDLALLSLDPAHATLSKKLEIEFEKFSSKFLKSYIAIQFAAKNSVGAKYLKFLRREYAQ